MDRITRFASTLLLCLLAAASAGASIIGVCPDGSMYIVPRAELIPCRDSKQVEPEDVPPIRPEMLSRPYGWEVFNRRNDPNNPYNIVDTGRAVRGEDPASSPQVTGPDPRSAGQPPRASQPETQTAERYASAPTPLPAVSAPPPPTAGTGSPDLALDRDEVRDLALIVEYSQRQAPATLERGGSPEAPGMVVRLAQSRSFEARLRDAADRAGTAVGGPVVLFSAVGAEDEAFYANLTFVQGHIAFHPETDQPGQLGLIEGRLGKLAPDESVLGYIVLPERMDLSQPMDIYWNDRQVTATLRP